MQQTHKVLFEIMRLLYFLIFDILEELAVFLTFKPLMLYIIECGISSRIRRCSFKVIYDCLL